MSEKNISRRSFMKLSAGVAAGVSLASYGVSTGLKSSSQVVSAEAADEGVKIIPTIGSHNCGGRCQVKAHVKDGVVQRITTDTEEETEFLPQLRACSKCRSYRRRLYDPHRLKYPMKRVGKRGEGNFERISWDKATDIIAEKLEEVYEKYGPEAIFVQSETGDYGKLSEQSLIFRLLGIKGGCLLPYGSYSFACSMEATPYTYGHIATGNSRDSWQHSKLIILWGFNPAENTFGTNTPYYLRKAKEAGAKIIVIDPRYTDTAAAFADEWIPNLPTTDNALMDAMTYVIITENLQDQEFLDKYCVGFDEEHMPEGVPEGKSLKSYILGLSDGIPKTPEWAEKISRVPADKIRQLAREFATTKPAALIQGMGPQRNSYGEQIVRGATVLPAITGNVGILGGWASGFGAFKRQSIASLPTEYPTFSSISMFTWPDAIERGHEMGPEDGVRFTNRLNSDLKFMFNIATNLLSNQHSDVNRTRKILEDDTKCEFILVSEQFMTPSAAFADILLPSDMNFEREDIFTPWNWGDYILYQNKAVETIEECRNGYDWISEVAEKMGIKDEFTDGKTREDWLRYIFAETKKNHPELCSFEEFRERGVFKWEYHEPGIAFKEQIEDPENNPFPTPTGKIEIFSKKLYDMNNPEEIPAIPKYIDSWEGPNDPLKEQYPLQCLGWHGKGRSHSTYYNTDWLREEVMPQEMWINPKDAKERGIENGERVHVFNKRGRIEIQAKVTPRIMPGVVATPEGAWYNPDENGVDQGGCLNVLTKYHPTPLAKGNPMHTNLVEVEKKLG